MQTYTLSEAKARFSEVVERALAGEAIVVTRMGKPAVRVVAFHEGERRNPAEALARARKLVQSKVKRKTLVDELIAERRREALDE